MIYGCLFWVVQLYTAVVMQATGSELLLLFQGIYMCEADFIFIHEIMNVLLCTLALKVYHQFKVLWLFVLGWGTVAQL